MPHSVTRREVNEYIRGVLLKLSRDGDDPEHALSLICECDRDCMRLVEIDFDVYEQVRVTPGWTVISPDHDGAPLGEVVQRGGTYRVVVLAQQRDE